MLDSNDLRLRRAAVDGYAAKWRRARRAKGARADIGQCGRKAVVGKNRGEITRQQPLRRISIRCQEERVLLAEPLVGCRRRSVEGRRRRLLRSLGTAVRILSLHRLGAEDHDAAVAAIRYRLGDDVVDHVRDPRPDLLGRNAWCQQEMCTRCLSDSATRSVVVAS